MKKCVHRESMPLKHYQAMGKGPAIEGMKVATVRKESKKFNQPMAHIYYKQEEQNES